MKKRLMLVISALLLILGLGAISSPAASNVAQAKCQRVQLIRKARVYNRRGLRKQHKILRRGRIFYLWGTRNIHGKNYYRIGRKSYIRVKTAKLILNPKYEIKPNTNADNTDK